MRKYCEKNARLFAALVINILLIGLPLHNASAEVPELFISLPHTPSLIVVSPDRNYVATAVKSEFTESEEIRVWNMQDGRELWSQSMAGMKLIIEAIAFAPRSDRIAVLSKDRTIIFDPASGKIINSISNGGYSIAYSRDGNVLAIGGEATITLWDEMHARLVQSPTSKGGFFHDIAFTDDDKRIVALNSEALHWDIKSGVIKSVKVSWSTDISELSPDGRLVAIQEGSGIFRIRSTETGRIIAELPIDSKLITEAIVNFCTFSPDSRIIAAELQSGLIKFWDARTGALIKTLKMNTHVYAAKFSEDGSLLAMLGMNYSRSTSDAGNSIVMFLDMRKWEIMKSWQLSSVIVPRHIAFSPNGKSLAVANKREVILWNTKTGKKEKTLTGATETILAIRFSSTGSTVKAFCVDRVMLFWDVDSGGQPHAWTVPASGSVGNSNVHLSDDGHLLVVAESDKIRVYDSASRRELAPVSLDTFGISNRRIKKVALTNNARLLAISSSEVADTFTGLLGREYWLHVWDVISNRLLLSDQKHDAAGLLFGPDGQLLTFGTDGPSFNPLVEYQEAWNTKHETILWDLESRRSSWIKREECYVTSAAISNSIRRIAFDSCQKIVMRDQRTGKLLLTLQGHNKRINSIAFSNNGKLLSSSSDDGTIRIWDAKTGSEYVKLINLSDGGWIAITPEGYYDASPGADKYVNVRIGNKVYGIDQYREQFYRPEVVQAALAGKPIKDRPSLAAVKPAPSVSIVDTPSVVDQEEVKVHVRVTDQGGGIGNVRIYDGMTAVLQQDSRDIAYKRKPTTANGQTFVFTIRLDAGKHTLSVIAFNAENSMSSVPAEHNIESRITEQKPMLHAFIIGIDKFNNPDIPLKYAVADAVLMEQTLNEKAPMLYKGRVDIRRFSTPSQTTKEEILKEFVLLSDRVKPEDTFLFYVASHGTVDGDEYFLLTSSVRSLSSRELEKTALTKSQIVKSISNIHARRKLIIIDTCNSGKLAEAISDGLPTRSLSEATAMKLLARATGISVYSATTPLAKALEGYKGHGVFTYLVAEGLNGGADENKDRFVFTTELAEYIEKNLPELSVKAFGREQYPLTVPNRVFPILQIR